MQPMSCTDEVPTVEREIELPAPPAEVWEFLPALLGDDVELTLEAGGRLRADGPEGERVGVVEELDTPRRLSFWWVPSDGDDAPSFVEVELAGAAVGTLLRVARRASMRPPWWAECSEVRLPAHAPDRVFAALSDPTRCRVVERLGLAPRPRGRSRRSSPSRARRW